MKFPGIKHERLAHGGHVWKTKDQELFVGYKTSSFLFYVGAKRFNFSIEYTAERRAKLREKQGRSSRGNRR